MKMNDEEKILKMISGLLNNSETEGLKRDLEDSTELKNFKLHLEDELSEMKEVYQSFPEKNYFYSLSNSVLNKTEERKTSFSQPSFAYALLIAFVVFVTSQLIDFKTNNFNSEYTSLINASDIENYISFDQVIDIGELTDILISDNDELDYAGYLLSNTDPLNMFQSYEENEIINLLDESVEDAIVNELTNKKIL